MMDRIDTTLAGLCLLRNRIFGDERGCFEVTFQWDRFVQATGYERPFVQDNESTSHKGVLRGLHYQAGSHAQAKLIRVAHGAVLDVCLDIRPDSPTFGQHYKVRLDAGSGDLLFIPEGFAHGFVSLMDGTVFCYKCSAPYHPPAERTILWNDPALGIDWGIDRPIVSAKDAAGVPLAQVDRG